MYTLAKSSCWGSLRARICALPTADDIAHGSCLACSSLVWLVVMSSRPSRRRSREEAFTTPVVPNASSASLAAWARKWMRRSLAAGELKSHEEEPITEVLEVVASP